MAGERPAAWYPDPSRGHDRRYWDGTAWTEHVADQSGNQGTDGPAPGLAEPSADDVASSTAVTAVAIPAVLTIGDITVTEDRILTPNGTAPLKGSQWFVRDLSRTEEKIPTSAIVLAIIFSVFCLLGLLFLLQKERRTTGYVEVEVRSGKLTHTTQIPVSSPYVVNQVRALVAQAQALAGQPPEESEQASRPEASDLTAKLKELGDLRDRGVLTDEEFQAQKSKLLGDSY